MQRPARKWHIIATGLVLGKFGLCFCMESLYEKASNGSELAAIMHVAAIMPDSDCDLVVAHARVPSLILILTAWSEPDSDPRRLLPCTDIRLCRIGIDGPMVPWPPLLELFRGVKNGLQPLL